MNQRRNTPHSTASCYAWCGPCERFMCTLKWVFETPKKEGGIWVGKRVKNQGNTNRCNQDFSRGNIGVWGKIPPPRGNIALYRQAPKIYHLYRVLWVRKKKEFFRLRSDKAI